MDLCRLPEIYETSLLVIEAKEDFSQYSLFHSFVI